MEIVEALELWFAEHCTEPMSVTLTWPATGSSPEEAQRLADEQWCIEIRPVRG